MYRSLGAHVYWSDIESMIQKYRKTGALEPERWSSSKPKLLESSYSSLRCGISYTWKKKWSGEAWSLEEFEVPLKPIQLPQYEWKAMKDRVGEKIKGLVHPERKSKFSAQISDLRAMLNVYCDAMGIYLRSFKPLA